MYFPVSALLIEYMILTVVESKDSMVMKSVRQSRKLLILKNLHYIRY